MNATSFSIAALLVLTLTACVAPGPDSVKESKLVNAAQESRVSKAASIFLVEMVDARLMDFQEGKLAAERGTQPAIRDYGLLMMRDQTALLAQLNALAAQSQVIVPSTIGADKRDGLKNLLEAEGKTFDKRFISSIRIDHERDVKKFGEATKFDDPAVRDFATAKLPLIESHLEGIRQIDRNN